MDYQEWTPRQPTHSGQPDSGQREPDRYDQADPARPDWQLPQRRSAYEDDQNADQRYGASRGADHRGADHRGADHRGADHRGAEPRFDDRSQGNGGYTAADWGAPMTGTGHTPARPQYAEPDQGYPSHSYWDQPADRRTGSLTPADASTTGSWRLNDSFPNRLTPAPAGPDLGSFDDDRDYPAVLWWTGIWYAVPLVVYILMALILSTSSMRGHALHALVSDALGIVLAIAISLGLAVALRRLTLSWRAITAGFGAAVVGGALATLLASLF